MRDLQDLHDDAQNSVQNRSVKRKSPAKRLSTRLEFAGRFLELVFDFLPFPGLFAQSVL
jgi:hypothetical protein